FNFVGTHTLWNLDAYNGGQSPSLIAISCAGLPTARVQLGAGRVVTIVIGWTKPCRTVTISSSNGWYTNFNKFKLKSLYTSIRYSATCRSSVRPSCCSPTARSWAGWKSAPSRSAADQFNRCRDPIDCSLHCATGCSIESCVHVCWNLKSSELA